MFRNWGWFQWVVVGTMLLFLGIITIVVVIAEQRKSGRATINAAEIQQARFELSQQDRGQ